MNENRDIEIARRWLRLVDEWLQKAERRLGKQRQQTKRASKPEEAHRLTSEGPPSTERESCAK